MVYQNQASTWMIYFFRVPYTYDDVDRVLSAPGQGTTNYSYNGLTSSIQKTAASGVQITNSTNNVLGQLQSVKDSNNGLLTYFYDAFGNLKKTQTSGVDFTSSSIVMGYDIRGNKISMNDPNMGDWTYRYNSFCELVEQTDAKCQKTRMLYDVLGRMIQRNAYNAGGALVDQASWEFDFAATGIGKLFRAKNLMDGLFQRYFYDSLGRQKVTQTKETSDPTIYTTSNVYNPYSGQQLVTVYPESNLQVRYLYRYGFLSSIARKSTQGSWNAIWRQTELSADGSRNIQTLGNGLQIDRIRTDTRLA